MLILNYIIELHHPSLAKRQASDYIAFTNSMCMSLGRVIFFFFFSLKQEDSILMLAPSILPCHTTSVATSPEYPCLSRLPRNPEQMYYKTEMYVWDNTFQVGLPFCGTKHFQPLINHRVVICILYAIHESATAACGNKGNAKLARRK